LNKIVVFGNGESRLASDISFYKEKYITVGCNAISRDIAVDYLICCDRRMSIEAIDSQTTDNTTIYVRPAWYHFFKKYHNIKPLPPLPFNAIHKYEYAEHWGSGPYAILIAAMLNITYVELIGFDLYDSNFLVNNVYKNTKNYATASSHPVDPSYWIYQISLIFDRFANTTFVIKNYQDWKMPITWQKNNVKFIAL
jgi:hypothetical protein